MINLVVLTSSRADYGIYLPLLKKLEKSSEFDLSLIVFGSHLSRFHGFTLDTIKKDGFQIEAQVESLILGDTKEAISNAIGNTVTKFSSIWANLENKINLVMALGDRYEMFAAISALIPFNIPVAHLHGGETTLGAIDNTFRHALSIMSNYHFVSTENYAEKVSQIMGSKENIYNVGALSLDNIDELSLLSKKDFFNKFAIDLSTPTILTTFHPETVSAEKNGLFADILCEVFDFLTNRYQIVITMPNTDTMGTIIREKFNNLSKQNTKVITIENFGTRGYFTCMKHCTFLLGNTSSGIIEAASFNKFVLNLGDRQKGRATSGNILETPIKKEKILKQIENLENRKDFKFKGKNIYHLKNSADTIISKLNQIF